jgi:nucleotide-binding universal stress UspA family protein
MAALDFSETSDGALDSAVELARSTGASLYVMTALDDGETERSAKQHLARVVERAGGSDVKVVTHVERGDPRDVILHAAGELGVDLIVMGTHARSSMTRLGSVAEAVTRTSSIPVMIVRHAPPRS